MVPRLNVGVGRPVRAVEVVSVVGWTVLENPGARRRTAARTVQDRAAAGAEISSVRSDSRKREMVV